jgi:hydroxymethylpyrimidine pyrophosphatase-like HAD family hydrolase
MAERTRLRATRPPRRGAHGAPPLVALIVDLDRTLIGPTLRPTIAARAALRRAQQLGLRTLLVSGREYPELRRMARGYPHLDGIVAENGAVVETPLGSPPLVFGLETSLRVRSRLGDARGLHEQWGLVVVSFPRHQRERVLAAVRGLPVRLVPNVDRLMVLPRGVSKLTGARLAMRRLGHPHARFAAIGDAENDVELLRGADLAGAVGNALPVAQRAADYVAQGRFGSGVREFVDGPVRARLRREALRATINDGRPGHGPSPR